MFVRGCSSVCKCACIHIKTHVYMCVCGVCVCVCVCVFCVQHLFDVSAYSKKRTKNLPVVAVDMDVHQAQTMLEFSESNLPRIDWLKDPVSEKM